MGRRHNEVESEEKLVPYKIVGGPNDLVKVDIDGKQFTPPEISAMVLRKLKEAAEAYLGHTVRKAVITVPAYFNDAQRQATIDAAAIAGFDTEYEIRGKDGKVVKQRMRIINEPTAAAIAYALDKKKDEKIAVFDLGGGTFDISILDVGEDGVFQVLSTNGDTHLGGDDFDQVLMDYIADEFKKENGIDLRKDPMAMQRLKEAAEQAKKDLEPADEHGHQPAVHHDGREPQPAAPGAVDHPQPVRADGRAPDRAVQEAGARGAEGREAAPEPDRRGRDGRRHDAHAARAATGEGDLRQGGAPGREPGRGGRDRRGDPGAQLLLGAAADIQLLDVTPLSLGIETLGGVLTPMITAEHDDPEEGKTETFTTAADNQPSVEVQVFQGERPMARRQQEDRQLPPRRHPAGPGPVPKIEVTFEIDANGVLSVSAKDLGTGKQQQIRIEGSSGMSKDEVEKMKRDAELHADEDKKKREFAEAKNEAETRIHEVEKAITEAGDKLTDATRRRSTRRSRRSRTPIGRSDLAALKTATAELERASSAMAQHVYSKAGGQPGAEPGPDAGDAEEGRRRRRDRRRVRGEEVTG